MRTAEDYRIRQSHGDGEHMKHQQYEIVQSSRSSPRQTALMVALILGLAAAVILFLSPNIGRRAAGAGAAILVAVSVLIVYMRPASSRR
jgi:Flp pilus assembly protein TadB